MKTTTNREDSFMWREAQRAQTQRQEREDQISDVICYYIVKMRMALRDDFKLDDEEITRRIREAL
jgi:hypothetical protein